MKINKISIVGMGDLEILFGNYFVEKLGKDAGKIGNELTFSNLGQLCIGIPKEEYKRAMFNDLDDFFNSINILKVNEYLYDKIKAMEE